MTFKRLILCMVLPALLMGTAAQGATMFINDFSGGVGKTNTDFEYTSDGGDFWYTPDRGMAPQDDPWLSSGTTPWETPTAKFYNDPNTGIGRARHMFHPGSHFNAASGISVAYRMRMAVGGGQPQEQVEIATTHGMNVGAWIRLRHDYPDSGGQSVVDIGRYNNPASFHYDYSPVGDGSGRDIDLLYLGRDLTDEWADWSVSMIHNPDDTSGGANWVYYRLFLDGVLLQFDGEAGGLNLPQWQDLDWSFRVRSGGATDRVFIGTDNRYSSWDMEFDYFNYRTDGNLDHWVPEPASLLLLAFGGLFLRRRRI